MYTTVKEFVTSLAPDSYIVSFGHPDYQRQYFTLEEVIAQHTPDDEIWQRPIQVHWNRLPKTAVLVKVAEEEDRETMVIYHKSALIEYPIRKPTAIVNHASNVACTHEALLRDGCTDRALLTKGAIGYVLDEELNVPSISPYHRLTDDRNAYIKLFIAGYVNSYISCVKKHKSA
ncbi:hypothetical protein [Dictyobacter kobayashii]|uniref:Uncharacterized protein n=1 Tax=Dictyobacter kobayashii TaxID=2014872 RepID=A0A402AEQ4_9CHLR|nr:hypothetical protein [Dictyobacter kobayashii]GCE17564.1 hypothetical protein KDK_13640 [Dictyobacter kobayashii]